MLARLMRNPGTLYLALGCYFAIHVLLRLVLPPALELGEARQIVLAQWPAMGYDGRAPLAIWLQHGLARLLGAGMPALALLGNLLLFAACLLVGGAAFLTIRNRALAIVAVLGMLTLPQVAYEAERDLGALAMGLFAASFWIYALFATLARGTLFAYLLLGIATGAGLLADYGLALLLGAALVAILAEPAFRGRLGDWRIVAAILVAGAILAPHGVWLADHAEFMMRRVRADLAPGGDIAGANQVIAGLFSLATAVVAFGGVCVAAFWIAFGRRFTQSWTASSRWSRLLGLIFVIVVLVLAGLVVFGSAAKIPSRWLAPYFFLLPLYFCLKLDALNQTIGNAPNRYGFIIAATMAAVPLALAARAVAPHWTGDYGKPNLPDGRAIGKILAEGRRRPSLVMTADMRLAGNIRLAAPDLPVVTPDVAQFARGYAFDAAHPLLVVWRGGMEAPGPMPEALARLLARQVAAGGGTPVAESVTVPYLLGRMGDGYRLDYAWIHPEP